MPKTQDELLRLVSSLAREMGVRQNELNDLILQQKAKAEELRQISDEDIPDLMMQIGLQEFTLTDGSFIQVKPFYSASISADNHDRAFQWLRDNDFGDMIKNNIVVTLGRGEDATATALMEQLSDKEIPFEQKEAVHASTLKAWVKEQVEKKCSVPPQDIFGLYIANRAVVKIKEAK